MQSLILQEQQKKRQEQWALWEKRLQEEVRKERLQLFKKMDADKSHPKLGLNLKELRAVLEDHGDYTDDAALKALFEAMDADGNGDISFEEANAYEDKPVVSEPITWESMERAASSAAAVAASAASSAAAAVSEGASAAAAAAAEATATVVFERGPAAAAAASEPTIITAAGAANPAAEKAAAKAKSAAEAKGKSEAEISVQAKGNAEAEISVNTVERKKDEMKVDSEKVEGKKKKKKKKVFTTDFTPVA
jgi:hypothetical protein